ncbi:type I methionyl aminopeptidase [Candidatus Peregrinibacteria bacterium]|nr:type I methionyl aminopeptidase [Candidatus Peregrinibacteria bacterium]
MLTKIKSAKEIESMRRGGKILGEILAALEKFVRPGITTQDIENESLRLFKHYGVQAGFKGYNGYPATLCVAVNEEVVHTIPGKRVLREGDILSIDCGVLLDGLNTDSAVAIIVGRTSPEIKKFVDTCIRAAWAGIKQVKPGNRVGDIGHAIEEVVKRGGYSIIPELTGHGIGEHLHEEPYVYNYGKAHTGMSLKPGMTIAIEPILAMGSPKIYTDRDGWNILTRDGSFGIQHEHTVLVTESGVEVLTLRPGEIS